MQSAAEFCWVLGHPESAATGGRAESPAGGALGGVSRRPLGRPPGTAPALSPVGVPQMGPLLGTGSDAQGTQSKTLTPIILDPSLSLSIGSTLKIYAE